jgi:Rrf2 family protein
MISTTGQYALRAMTRLAQGAVGQYLQAEDLGRDLEIPPKYLSKVLQTLARQGLLAAHRGRRGGYRLDRPAHTVTLYEILAAVAPMDRYNACILGHKVCSDDNPCPIHKAWQEARDQVLSLLRKTSLADLTVHAGELAAAGVPAAPPPVQEQAAASAIGAE